ncbi:unnamed protein product [Camellia sinensis]
MSKSSSSFIIRYLHHHHHRHIPSKPSPPTYPNSSNGISQLLSHHHPNLTPWRTHFSSSSIPRIFQNPPNQLTPQPNLLLNRSFLGFRYFSFKNSELGTKINGNFAKNAVKNPTSAVRDAFSRYQEAVGLQIEAFWKRNSLVLWGAGGLMVCILLWKALFGVANMFIGLSEGMAKYGFLALSSAIVAFTNLGDSRMFDRFINEVHTEFSIGLSNMWIGHLICSGLYLRSRFTINPDKVYRMAMRWLNTNAGILEVMGAPLTGTDLRAYVMSGGGITLKNFKPGLRNKRCFLIFPIQGSERKGLVSVEVKNKKGQYDMKLLAVDIPMATGPDQRIYIIGDEAEYRVGGGLISELRDPVVKAMAAVKEFEDHDKREDEEDAKRELQEAERRHKEEIEKLEKGS